MQQFQTKSLLKLMGEQSHRLRLLCVTHTCSERVIYNSVRKALRLLGQTFSTVRSFIIFNASVTIVRIRGIFVTELARMLFSKRCMSDSIPEPLFPGIAITNAIPL